MKTKLQIKKTRGVSFKKILAPFQDPNNKKIFGTIISLFSILLIIAFISYLIEWKNDDSILSQKNLSILNKEIKNQIGGLGAQISYIFIKLWFGVAAFFIPFVTLAIGLKILGVQRLNLNKIIFNSILALIIVPIFISHFFGGMITAGGVGIHVVDKLLIPAIGKLGTSLTIITSILLYITISFNINSKKIQLLINKFKSLNAKQEYIKEEEEEEKKVIVEKEEEKIEDKENKEITKTKEQKQNNEISTSNHNLDNKRDENQLGFEVINTKNEETLSKSDIEKKLEELGDFDPTLELSQFKMPAMDLLKEYGKNKIEIDKEELENNKNRIVETLGHYKIGISSISATVGPTITLYEIVPEAGIRISKIKNLEDDISLSLAAEGIRIIAPIPGKGTIGIEVPNANKNIVSMFEVLQSEKFQNSKMELPIAFGKTISNETFVVDLAKMPHLLMAGATGQGKSVGLNAILVSLLYKKHPSQIKFVLVDPKKVELTLYNKIERHYLAKLP